MHTPTLHVDLSALRANYRLLRNRHARQSIAAVVKANAYGLGVETVSKALWNEGCRQFFVATLAEGIELRPVLPEAAIGIFDGPLPGEEQEYKKYRLMPTLNDPGQIAQWEAARGTGPGIIHIDTGMTRLGVAESDLRKIRHLSPATHLVMSHLACANEPNHPKNAEQLQRFHAALRLLPKVNASLANSSGLFLPPEYHFDVGRPGCALYGINPTPVRNPMQPVATLSAPIVQLRTLEHDETIGYGATYPAPKGSRIAIAGLGYADGWMRLLANTGFAYIGGYKVPLVGRISMDMLALNISQIPESAITTSTHIEFINKIQTVDDVATACGTIGYEIFTRLGKRVKRIYG